MAGRQTLCVQRTLHPAAVRQHLAAADAEAASAGVDSRQRQRRNLGLVRGSQFPVRLPVVLWLPAWPAGDGRLLGGGVAARTGAESVPRWISAVRGGGRQRCGGGAAV